MPNINIDINFRRPIGPAVWRGPEGLRHLSKFIEGVATGRVEADAIKIGWNDSVAVQDINNVGGQACGLIISASGSGAVGAVIGITTKTVTWGTSDTASMTALAAAIRADTTIGQFATATNKLMQLTCASVLAGDNVRICNQVFTAIANGVTPTDIGQFSIGATDTACALNLVNAINRHPAIAGRNRAVSLLGVVFIGAVDDRVPLPTDSIQFPSSTTIAVNAALPVAGSRCMVLAGTPGVIGRFIPLTASGTNISVATNGTAGYLGSGTGGALPAFTVDLQP